MHLPLSWHVLFLIESSPTCDNRRPSLRREWLGHTHPEPERSSADVEPERDKRMTQRSRKVWEGCKLAGLLLPVLSCWCDDEINQPIDLQLVSGTGYVFSIKTHKRQSTSKRASQIQRRRTPCCMQLSSAPRQSTIGRRLKVSYPTA